MAKCATVVAGTSVIDSPNAWVVSGIAVLGMTELSAASSVASGEVW